MNYFFALELPPDIREQIAEHSRRWRELLGPDFPARWHEPEDYHVTLKFLGDVPDERQSELIAAVAPLAAATGKFGAPMASPGTFPHERFVNVLLRRLRTSEGLSALQKEIEQTMAGLGFAVEAGGFSPHVTVARCTRRPKGDVTVLQDRSEQAFAVIGFDHFVLMRTTTPEARQKDRPIRYNIVHTFPLGDSHSSPTPGHRENDLG